MSKLLYTCQEATQLIVENVERKLTYAERFKLWLHIKVCAACKRFQIQNEWLDKQIEKLTKQSHEMPPACKNKIITELNKTEKPPI